MSSAAAAVLAGASTAASGIARRARVHSLDGMTRSFRVVSPSGPAASGTTRGRSRSLTSEGLSACYTSNAAKCVTARGRDALEGGFGGGRGGAGGAGANAGEGGQFLAGGGGAAAAAAALAVFAATPDSGENEWGHDKTAGAGAGGGSGGLLGGRSGGTAWCHAQHPPPPHRPSSSSSGGDSCLLPATTTGLSGLP